MRIPGALSICAVLSTLTIQVFAAVVIPPTAQAAALPAQAAQVTKPQYVALPVYVQIPGPPGTEPSYAQLYAPANSHTPASTVGQISVAPGPHLPPSTDILPPASIGGLPPSATGAHLAAPPGPQLPAPIQAPAVAPINTTLVAPVNATLAVIPNPSAELECKCPIGQTATKFAGLCICGDCGKVSPGVKSYNTACPDSKFAAFNKGLEKECKKIENTEDCEFFKKSPGALTDDYKRCRDQLDSIMDDCENDAKCCSTMVKPGAPAPVDD